MSFQAYLDTIEERTGLTPRQVLDIAREKGFDRPTTKAGDVVAWFKEDFDLGRGHAMALWYVLKNGPVAPGTHVRSGGTHSDPSETLWLDGKATMPVGGRR
jgi:hypothetical protein